MPTNSNQSPHKLTGGFSLGAQAERVAQFLRDLKITGRIHVAGTSMGGGLAGVFAAAYPELVKTVTLLCPAGIKQPVPSEAVRLPLNVVSH